MFTNEFKDAFGKKIAIETAGSLHVLHIEEEGLQILGIL